MSLVSTITKQVSKLPPDAIESVKAIIESAVASGDPARYLKRLAIAEAATTATKKVAAKVLSTTATKKK